MANLNEPIFPLLDDNGNPAVNGFALVEVSGSPGVKKDTFRNSNLTESSKNENPIPLDSAGKLPFDAFYDGAARITTFADGLSDRTYDPFPGPASGLDSLAPWNAIITYPKDALVTADDGNFYTSVGPANQNNNPISTTGKWIRVRFMADWIAEGLFDENDLVVASDKNLYLSIAGANLGNDPVTTSGFWKATTIDFTAINTDFTFIKANPVINFNDDFQLTDGIKAVIAWSIANNILTIDGDVTLDSILNFTGSGDANITRPTNGGALNIIGGASGAEASQVRLFDLNHGSLPGYIQFKSGVDVHCELNPVAGVWDFQDNDITTTGSITSGADNAGINFFRTTLTSGVPVTTSDVLAATTVFVTPNGKGNIIALFDGTKIIHITPGELSVVVPSTTDTNFDVFVDENAGSPIVTTVDWETDIARFAATDISVQNGFLALNGSPEKRYVTTLRTTGVSGQTEDSLLKRFLWNYYNRRWRPMQRVDTGNSWIYTNSTFRQANGSTNNQLNFVLGLNEDMVEATVLSIGENSTVGVSFATGIGLDSTTTATGIYGENTSFIADHAAELTAHYKDFPGLGFHRLVWLERSEANGTTRWIGDDGGPGNRQTGINGGLWG